MNISIFKTVLFNLYYLPYRFAIKFPIRVARNTKIIKLGARDALKLDSTTQKVYIGFGESFALGNRTGWKIEKGGKVHFHGDAIIGRGTQIIVGKYGMIEFGNNFICNANCLFNAGISIKIGDDCMIGWNVEMLDGDGHQIISQDNSGEMYFPIKICNHVWIASHSMILKGVTIRENCVVAAKSCVTKSNSCDSCVIKDNFVLKNNIRWKG